MPGALRHLHTARDRRATGTDRWRRAERRRRSRVRRRHDEGVRLIGYSIMVHEWVGAPGASAHRSKAVARERISAAIGWGGAEGALQRLHGLGVLGWLLPRKGWRRALGGGGEWASGRVRLRGLRWRCRRSASPAQSLRSAPGERFARPRKRTRNGEGHCGTHVRLAAEEMWNEGQRE